jgi:hypothetical protein
VHYPLSSGSNLLIFSRPTMVGGKILHTANSVKARYRPVEEIDDAAMPDMLLKAH